MLTKSELRLLSEISNNLLQTLTVKGIADTLDWSESYASRVVSDLHDRGYVQTDRSEGEKWVSLANIQPVQQLGALNSEFSHVDFPELIAGSALQILYYLDQPRTASELAERSSVSRGTVYRRLETLQRVGIARKDHSKYELTDSFSSLSDFARAVAHHEHQQEALEYTSTVTILWETHDEYLISCKSTIQDDRFHQTGPTVFEEFGIPLFTREQLHYFRSEQLDQLTPADLVCHMLLIDDSTRYRTYCLLLIASHNVDSTTLGDRAQYYNRAAEFDLSMQIEELQAYLTSQGTETTERLPAWEEFKETAANYDISV